MAFPLAAVAGFLGGSVASGAQWFANNYSARQSQSRAHDFTEYMSSTAHQREVADLRAAGLNPILSGTGGHGAPGGAGVAPGTPGLDLVSSAYQGARMRDELRLLGVQVEATAEQADLNQAQRFKAKTEADLAQQAEYESQAREDKTRAEIAAINKQFGLTDAQIATEKEKPANMRADRERTRAEEALTELLTELQGYSAPGAKFESEIDESWYGKAMRILKRWRTSGAADAARDAEGYADRATRRRK